MLSQNISKYQTRNGEKIMATCKECEFYKEIDETKGDCFGHEVPADADVSHCPTKSFKPR